MHTTDPVLLMHTLKGSAATCLLTLMIAPAPVTARWIALTTGYAPNTVTHALSLLEQLGLATHDGQRSGWRTHLRMAEAAPVPEPVAAGQSNDPEAGAPPADPIQEEHPGSAPPKIALQGVANCDGLKLEAESLKLGMINTTCLLAAEAGAVHSRSPAVVLFEPVSQPGPNEAELTPECSAGEPARLLMAAEVLFGEPVAPLRGQELPPGVVLAWIAQAYDQRHRLRKPARVIYAGLKRGELPSHRYLDDPLSCLPARYLEAAGLRAPPVAEIQPPSVEDEPPEEEPEADPPLLEPHPSLSLPMLPGSSTSAQQAWQQVLEVALEHVSSGPLRQHLKVVEPLYYDPGQGIFTLQAKDAQGQQMLQERLGKLMQRWLQGICQREVRVRFEHPPPEPP